MAAEWPGLRVWVEGRASSRETGPGEADQSGSWELVREGKMDGSGKAALGGRSLYLMKAASRRTQRALPEGAAPNPTGPGLGRTQEGASLSPGRRLFRYLLPSNINSLQSRRSTI